MSSVSREIYELFDKYGKLLASQPYPLGQEARLILDTEDGVFGTKKGVRLDKLKWSDIVKMADGHLGTYRSGMVARVVSQTPYCQQCLQEGLTFRAPLDDMAQIVGPEAVIVNMTIPNKKKASMQMARAAANAAGFFVQDRVRDGLPAGYTLTVGRSLYEAVNAALVLEKSAEISLKSRVIGGCKPLSKFSAKSKRTSYLSSYSAAEAEARSAEMRGVNLDETGVDAVSPWDEKEGKLRQVLVDYGRKLQETGLVQGTWGNLSVRLDDDFMLVTPSGMDYSRLTAADMVKVHISTLEHEGALKPTSEKGLHAAIYQKRPDVRAVVHTHSRYCSIFAAANRALPVGDAEAQQVFGTSVNLAKYANAGSDKLAKNVASALGNHFGCLMANHGMVTCGGDMETAFDNCQLMESIAEAYIESRWE